MVRIPFLAKSYDFKVENIQNIHLMSLTAHGIWSPIITFHGNPLRPVRVVGFSDSLL